MFALVGSFNHDLARYTYFIFERRLNYLQKSVLITEYLFIQISEEFAFSFMCLRESYINK